jgi:hypothetical protein
MYIREADRAIIMKETPDLEGSTCMECGKTPHILWKPAQWGAVLLCAASSRPSTTYCTPRRSVQPRRPLARSPDCAAPPPGWRLGTVRSSPTTRPTDLIAPRPLRPAISPVNEEAMCGRVTGVPASSSAPG